METFDEVSQEHCDNETIHIPGTTQKFGCLVAFERRTRKVTAISQNSADFIGKHPDECLGQPLNLLFERGFLHVVSNKLTYSTIRARREYVATIQSPSGSEAPPSLDVFILAGPKYDYLEFVQASAATRAAQGSVAAMTSTIQKLETLPEIFKFVTQSVHAIAEYHRTIFYRFLPDGSGEVVSERRSGFLEPLKGMRYPANDIPIDARKLFESIPIRVIANIKAASIPMRYAEGLSAKDLDLSHAVLCGISESHCEFLSKMEVSASMTIPVVVEGKLWGLIICHNEVPRVPSMDMLDSAEVIGHIVSFCVAKVLTQRNNDQSNVINDIRGTFSDFRTGDLSANEFLGSVADSAEGAIDFDGLGLSFGSDWFATGAAPGQSQGPFESTFEIEAPFKSISASNDAKVALSASEQSNLSGFLQIPLADDPETNLVFFRKELKAKIESANIHLQKRDDDADKESGFLMQRFRSYLDDHGHCAEDWDASDIDFAIALQKECTATLGGSGRALRQEDSLRFLANEMNHRVKNILALVKSLSSHARDSNDDSDGYAESLEKRLFSLAAAHDMMTRSQNEGLPLRVVAQMELAPYLSTVQIEEAISGPDVILSADAVLMVTLLFHELASNAVKHGSLSASGGTVSIKWQIVGELFSLSWHEDGGPLVQKPKRQGFGLELLREALPFEFGGTADLRFLKFGFEASYTLPASPFLKKGPPGPPLPEENRPLVSIDPKAERGRAFILEDSYLLASEHAKILERIGFSEVDRASSIRVALSMLDEHRPDFALLDINLRGEEVSFPIAVRLIELGVPFAFVTGYGSISTVPSEFANVKLIQKPLTQEALQAVLTT